MKLEIHEAQGPLWTKLKKHLQSELESLRAKNDKDLPEQKTARLRGRIEQVKDLLAMGEPGLPIEEQDIFKD